MRTKLFETVRIGGEIKQRLKRTKPIIAVVIAVIVCAILVVSVKSILPSRKSESEIISKTMLEKIINVSDLSSFKAVYNGVAKVVNEEDSEKVDYYVSYNAEVKAGIDFEKVAITVDNENKVISVEIPEVKITDVNVDITSLDYIFENNRANTSTVSEQAYKKCIEDAKNESSSEDTIYELAEQNVKNTIEALISPFVEQLDAEYQLQID